MVDRVLSKSLLLKSMALLLSSNWFKAETKISLNSTSFTGFSCEGMLKELVFILFNNHFLPTVYLRHVHFMLLNYFKFSNDFIGNEKNFFGYETLKLKLSILTLKFWKVAKSEYTNFQIHHGSFPGKDDSFIFCT